MNPAKTETSTPTPGPWEAEPGARRGAWIKGSNGEWAALACGDDDATALANAHLIAAAPNLLAQLEETQSLLAAMLHEPRPAAEIEAQILANRIAITIAEGQS